MRLTGKFLALGLATTMVFGSLELASAAPRHGVGNAAHGRVASRGVRGGGRHYATRGYRGGGNAGGAAFAGAALGLMGAAIAGAAASNAYDDGGYYGNQGYGYYGGNPGYGYYGRLAYGYGGYGGY